MTNLNIFDFLYIFYKKESIFQVMFDFQKFKGKCMTKEIEKINKSFLYFTLNSFYLFNSYL